MKSNRFTIVPVLSALMALFFLINNVFAFKIELTKIPFQGWTLIDENGNPMVIKGVCYSPTPVGKSVWDMNLYSDDPSIRFVDAEKMQLMGANVLRMYHPGSDMDGTQKFIRQLNRLYSIYTIFPLPLEMQGADYASPQYRNTIKKEILKMVRDYKDTDGIIVWLLGNEVDYYFSDDKAFWETKDMQNISSPYRKALARARIVFEFANEVAAEIKKIDKDHPVGLSLGKLDFFNILKETVTNVDFIGLNYYQGKTFSSVWNQSRKIGKPFLITEFGYDSYNTKKGVEDEDMQSRFIVSLWKDIEKNTYLKSKDSVSIGGCIFEWTDEWWKGGDSSVQETNGQWVNPAWPDFSPDMPNVQEAWFGIMKVEKSGNGSIDTRIPKQTYFDLKRIWNASASAPVLSEPEQVEVQSSSSSSEMTVEEPAPAPAEQTSQSDTGQAD